MPNGSRHYLVLSSLCVEDRAHFAHIHMFALEAPLVHDVDTQDAAAARNRTTELIASDRLVQLAHRCATIIRVPKMRDEYMLAGV